MDTAYTVLGAVRNGKWQVLLQKQKKPENYDKYKRDMKMSSKNF